MVRRVALVLCVAVGLSLAGMGPAQASYTSTLVGTTATVTGDAALVDTLSIGKSAGNLTLNGNPDWDSVAGGSQTLADSATSTVVINAGDGIDVINIGSPGDTFASSFTVNGEFGTDFLFVYPGGSVADTVTITGNGLTGPDLGHVAWDGGMEQVNIRTGDGADVVNVTATPTSPQVLVYAQDGDDTLKLANGTGLGTGGALRGGPGTDTVDYSAYTTAVAVDLGKTARFVADLSGGAVVPPSGSGATGFASVDFTNLGTNTFDYEIDVTGLTAAQITDAHFHAGAVGANGATILPIGAGASWSSPGTPQNDVLNATDPDITEPALRPGNTYVDVHAAGGDIRGQLALHPEDGYGGTATGLSKVFTVENVVGGSGNDTLKGSVPHNTFNCGPGRDTVSADSTDTLVNCDRGGTGSVSPLKPKAKAKGKKVTIDTGATAACPATAPSACSVTATATAKLGKKSASFGTVKATPAAGSSLRVVLKVPKKTLKAWRKAGKVKITFTITITVPDGTPATVTKTAKLKAPKAK